MKEQCDSVSNVKGLDPSLITWCRPQPGLFFVCGNYVYQWLPANWTGACTLAFVTPQINIVPRNQSLWGPIVEHGRTKRAVQIILSLVGLGISAGVGAAAGGWRPPLPIIIRYLKDSQMTRNK